jgi:hypothetical protein
MNCLFATTRCTARHMLLNLKKEMSQVKPCSAADLFGVLQAGLSDQGDAADKRTGRRNVLTVNLPEIVFMKCDGFI